MWSIKYQEKIDSELEGASLSFGSAIDAAVSAMLEGNPDFVKIFYENWKSQWVFGQAKQVWDNPSISYGHKDLDADLLEPKDYPDLERWAKELNLLPLTAVPTNSDLIDLYKTCSKAKANPYIKISAEQLLYFNRASWLGLKRKGKIMLNSFHQQFYPKIKKVHAVQKRADLKDHNTGDSLTGFVDMVVDLEGYDKPVILDLKTSSMAYEQHKLDVSPQLTLYAAMIAQEYNTDLVGYVVLNKMISKDEQSTCKTCNHSKDGRHVTCNATKADGSRCGGVWNRIMVPNPQVQVMIAQKTQDQINDQLSDYSNIIVAMKNNVIWKNTEHCQNHFGAPCPFIKYCHNKGDMTGLKKR